MSAPQAPAPSRAGAAALPAFASVTIDPARPQAVPAPDPRVAAAFALGWQMAELYRPGRRIRRSPASSDDLPGLARLDEQDLLQLGVDQLKAGLAALGETIGKAGLDLPDLGPVEGAVTNGGEDARRR